MSHKWFIFALAVASLAATHKHTAAQGAPSLFKMGSIKPGE